MIREGAAASEWQVLPAVLTKKVGLVFRVNLRHQRRGSSDVGYRCSRECGEEGPATALSRSWPSPSRHMIGAPPPSSSSPDLSRRDLPLVSHSVLHIREPARYPRLKMASICARQSAAIPRRFAQANARRGFSTRSYMSQEVRDAYILSAARTPTAKVRIPVFQPCSHDTSASGKPEGANTRSYSSMAPSPRSPRRS